ncbi:MAG TPA: serine/threonine-protein kinase [Kofleriaceae bacterium]
MLHLCPTCRRQFDEAGFCPFDGTALFPDTAEQQTLPSGEVQARGPGAAPGARTELEVGKRTFPLTPSPAAPPATSEITQRKARPGPGPSPAGVRAPSDPPRVKALSASEDPSEALELIRAPGANEYDKLVGQTLDGRYYIERKIGEGGMGVVFRARHAIIERPLAIKVLKREAMRDTATIRRFVQEAKAASRIGHPNIVDVTDFGTTPDGMTYSVMEFVPGMTLGAAIRAAAPFPEARALRVTAQIARALAAAHDKGIVHRDLKPENVFLLDRDGRPDFVKIVDFGIAKVAPPPGKTNEPRLTRAGSVFGTPEYMAPEQAAGRSDTDGRVDIYALGVIFYEMICGRVPHRGDSMVRTLAMQMLDPIDPPSKVRPDLHTAPELEAIDAILPPAVGQSVTGSPIYTLAALPPGADPGVVPALPAAPLASSEPVTTPARPRAVTPPPPTTPGVEPARASSPIRRFKDEPEFTAGDRRSRIAGGGDPDGSAGGAGGLPRGIDRPLSFQHVFAEELAPARRRRWPVLILFALIAGGAAGAFAIVVKTRGRVIAEAQRDAGVIALPADAGPPGPREPIDAATDAADLIVLPEPDAGRRIAVLPRRDAGARGAPDAANGRGTVTVQVLTRPEGANLYDGTTYRGPGGTNFEEPLGTRMTITCRQPGYQPGIVEVTFDGRTEAVLCVLTRIKRCIEGLKNPFDDCEPAP